MSGRFTIEAVFRAIDRFSAPVQKMSKTFVSSSKSITASVDKLNASADRVAGGLRRVVTLAGAASIALGGTAAFLGTAGMNFEQAVADVAAVSGATADELDRLKASAKELGSTSKFTSTEVVGAMEAMSKAGFQVNEILAGTPGIISAAAADGASIEETATSIMSAMKALGLGPAQMQLFADQMAKAGDSTAASIGTISQSLAIFGPVARQLNIPTASAIAQLALLQDAGIDASSAGTTLAAAYSKLAAPTKRTSDQLRKLGVSVADSFGNMKKPDVLLNEILASTGKIKGNVGKMAAFTQLVGLESQKALLNIADAAGKGKLGSLTAQLEKAAGYADELGKKRLDTFKGDLTLLRAAADGLQIALFETQGGPLRGIVQGMTKWVNANKDLAATKFTEAVETGTVLLGFFANGVKASVREVSFLVKPLEGAATWLNKLFGDGAPGKQAFILGQTVGRLTFGIIAFTAVTKTAAGATFLFEMASKGASAAAFVFGGIVKGLRKAMVLYFFISKAGVASTLALSFASKAAALDSARQTLATWASAAATRAYSFMTAIATFATKRFTIASIASTAWTVAKRGAMIAYNGVVRGGAFLLGLLTGATKANTGVSIVSTAWTWAKTAAEGANTAATWLATYAQNVYAVARGRATVATMVGTGATAGAALAMGALAFATMAVVGSVMLLLDALDELKEASAGLGITGIVGGMLEGKSAFQAVDDEYNRKALTEEEAAKRAAQGGSGERDSMDFGKGRGFGFGFGGMDDMGEMLKQMQNMDIAMGNGDMSGFDMSGMGPDIDMNGYLADMDLMGLQGGMPGMDPSMGMDPAAMLQNVDQLELSGSPQLVLPDGMTPIQDEMTITIKDESGRAEVSESPKGKTKVKLQPTGGY